MTDEMLKSFCFSELNEIKRLALLINDGDLKREEMYSCASEIVGIADDIIEEIKK